MEQEREAKLQSEKALCECYWNFDDKFEVLCEKHRTEAEEENERAFYEQV